MKSESSILLPFTSRVRRLSIFGGIVSAIFTGGIPFVGPGPTLAMGRFVPLASPLALILHLLLAIVYGGLLSIAIGRARGAWVFTAAVVGSLMLYAGNWWLLRASEIPVTAGESRALAAHFLFGFAFTIFFKMDEADAGERAVDHARAR